MTKFFHAVWDRFLKPMFFRPQGLQVAALCYRVEQNNKEILLVTSRNTRRWIIPKGWPITGKSCHEAALQEAWEEAGVVRAKVRKSPLGFYEYFKQRESGGGEPVRTLVYAAKVDALSDRYPESDQRVRRWASPQEAASLVQEPQLKELLKNF